jgi:hypothetical protein
VSDIAASLGPVARELLVAWSRLPARGFVPDRSDFDPMAVAHILPVVSIIERIGPDDWRFRLVGTEIERRWGRGITGSNITDIVSPPAVAVMRRELREIVERPCGSWSERLVALRSERRAVLETLRLPLRAGDGRVSLVLSCSGELAPRVSPRPDAAREIHTIARQRYVDIGAGCPPCGALDAGERPAAATD